MSGCGGGSKEVPQAVAAGPDGYELPDLVPVPIALGVDTLFWSDETTVGLFGNGHFVVYTPPISASASLVYLVNPFTGYVKSAGRRGEGPDEFSGRGVVLSGGDMVHVFDFSRISVVGISQDGSVGGRIPIPSANTYVLSAADDSIDFYHMVFGAEASVLVGRYAKLSKNVRTLIPMADAIIKQLVLVSGSRTSALRIPPYAANDHGFVIGDPLPYRLRFYDGEGRLQSVVERDVPFKRRTPEDMASLRTSLEMTLAEYGGGNEAGRNAAARLDTLEREAIPHFLWPGIGFDAAGRVWTVGALGDSTFADVFSETAFLKRFMLPCRNPRRRVAIQGEWILLHCEEPESISAPYRLQLYRIVESGG